MEVIRVEVLELKDYTAEGIPLEDLALIGQGKYLRRMVAPAVVGQR